MPLTAHCHQSCCHRITAVPLSSPSSSRSSLPLSLSLLPSLSTSPLSLLPSSLPSLLCCCHCYHHHRHHLGHRCFVVVVLVVLLGGGSKEFDQSKPRQYPPWHIDRAPALGLAVGRPTALLGKHLVNDVVLLEISWCSAMGVKGKVPYSTLRYPTVPYGTLRYPTVP
jgi:hypothetical protein